jgi:hypothetical protein
MMGIFVHDLFFIPCCATVANPLAAGSGIRPGMERYAEDGIYRKRNGDLISQLLGKLYSFKIALSC